MNLTPPPAWSVDEMAMRWREAGHEDVADALDRAPSPEEALVILRRAANSIGPNRDLLEEIAHNDTRFFLQMRGAQ